MYYIKQLEEFYRNLGLSGKELDEAVAQDVERVKIYAANVIEEDDDLACIFVWDETSQGWHYWNERDIIVENH